MIGVISSKYIPTGDMTAGDLRLEMMLANAVYAIVGAATSPKYTVSDVEMMLEHTDFASNAARMTS